MQTLITILHTLAALVVLAEALNKLERIPSPRHWLTAHVRWVQGLKALAWVLLALGAGGAVITPLLLATGWPEGLHTPLLRLERPTLGETCVLLGFAVLIVRTRVKEG
jgi:hypothetical protein